MFTKTVPTLAECEFSQDRYRQRMTTWARPEADRFGTWHDWSPNDVNYLLTELAEGHWDDSGDTSPGFAMSEAGCVIAMLANGSGDNLRSILQAFALGLRWMASTGDEHRDAEALAVAHKVLDVIPVDA